MRLNTSTLALTLLATLALTHATANAQQPPPAGTPVISDHWRFACQAKPVKPDRVTKLKDAVATSSASLEGAVTRLNYGCVVSQVELDTFQKRFAQFQKSGGQGKAPTIDRSVSTDQIKQATLILAELNKNPRRPVEALYQYGYALALAGDPLSVNMFDELATNYPSHPRASTSSLPLGEYYFGRSEWDKAQREYNTALRSSEEGIREYAEYKLSWTRFVIAAQARDVAAQKKSVGEFLAQYNANKASDSQSAQRLATVIQGNLIDILADMGDVPYAKRVLDQSGQKAMTPKFIERLAFARIDAKDMNGAYTLFTGLIKDYPTSPDNPRYMGYLVDIAGGQENIAALIKNLRFMVATYANPNSKWTAAQKPKIILKAAKDVEDLVFGKATAMDQLGRQNRNETYLNGALELYDLFTKSFTQSPRAIEVQFYWAQLLYERKQFADTTARLMAMLKADPKSKYAKDGADIMVTAAQSAVEADKTNYNLPKPGLATTPITLPLNRKNFADALDVYVKLFPSDANAPAMQYAAGSVYYDFGHYDVAAKRYYKYIKTNPNGQFAREAALRILYHFRKHKSPAAFAKTRDTLGKIPNIRSAPELASYFAVAETPAPAVTEAAANIADETPTPEPKAKPQPKAKAKAKAKPTPAPKKQAPAEDPEAYSEEESESNAEEGSQEE